MMQNAVKILSLGLIATVVLTACSNPLSKKVEENEMGVGRVKTEVVVAEVVEPAYGSKMECGRLKTEKGRQGCELQVNEMIGHMLRQEIVNTFDVGRCSELPDEVAKSCKKSLTETGVQGPVPAEEMAMFEDISRGRSGVQCADLKTPGYKAYCDREMNERSQRNLFNEIVISEDSGRCSELSDASFREQCSTYFNR